MRSRVQEKLAFDQNRNPEQVVEIPVSYTYFRSATGQVGGNIALVDNAYIDARINYLNEKFSGSGVHFYRLGNVNFIDNELFFANNSNGIVRENYSYVKTALNVYICPECGPFTNQPGSELYGAPVMHNTSVLNPPAMEGYHTYIHETGHNFGLLHTFGPAAKENGEPIYFDYPKVLDPILGTSVYDHPYEGERARELVIRLTSAGKPFPNPNCQTAGDFCCDTEADCSDRYERTFPEFDPSNVASCLIPGAACAGGCSFGNNCTYTGTYRDYNGDLIPGAFNNFMSYHTSFCAPPIFTTEQKGWIAFNYNKHWNGWLEDLPININDKVELNGSPIPMRDVVIRWKHPDPSRYTNCTSNATGDFQGILYDGIVKAEVRKIGSAIELAGTYQPPPPQGPQTYFKDAYTYADWIKDIDIDDLVRINKYISGFWPFDGYSKIAADANHSNSVTYGDVDVLRKLLLGQILKLPAFDAPWRFVPEYIPQDNLTQFNADPFHMNFSTINGQNPSGTPYTEPTWEYEIPADLNKRGYDGIKIGDVNGAGSSPTACETLPELEISTAQLMAPGQNFDITFKATGFADVESFQLGLFVDNSKLQVLDISSASLPGFSKADHAGLDLLENNQLNMLWFQSNSQPVSVGSQEELFKLKVHTLQPITDISAAINLNGDLPSKVFKNGCTSTPLQGFVAPSTSNRPNNRSTIEHAQGSTLFCYPNPVREQLNIAFESDFSGQGALLLVDMNGKTIYFQVVEIAKGINNLSLGSSAFSSLPAGVLSAILQTDANVFTGRLVKL